MKTLYTAEALASGEGRDGTARHQRRQAQRGPGQPGGTRRQRRRHQPGAALRRRLRRLLPLRAAPRRAARQKADLTDSAVAAKIHLGALADGAGYGLAAELEIALPAVDRDTAEALVAKAHEVCPYSNATRGNITVDIKILEVAA